MAAPYSIKFESNSPLMLRDGTITNVDIFRPDASGSFPALLRRTPYDKSIPPVLDIGVDAIRAAMRGYAVVIQDIRGRFSSEGEFYTFVDEMNDGYDSIEWVAGQPWCNGKVGMYGSSYVGATQWLAAKSMPPSLAAIAPGFTSSDYHEGWAWQGGAFQLGFNLKWTLDNLTSANWDNLANRLYLSPRQLDILIEAKDRVDTGYRYLPMKELPDLEGGMAPYYYDWLDHPEYDDYWERISIEESHSDITVPAFNYGGWYDIFLGGTLKNFTRMRELGGSEDARRGQRLAIGPWTHGGTGVSVAGERGFGSQASAFGLDMQEQILRYYDYWLKGEDNGVGDERPVKIFIMSENVWRTEEKWPLERAESVNYYLHSQGRANSLAGDGRLDAQTPALEEPPDVYVYNPIDPVPTRGGQIISDPGIYPAGVYDQRPIEARHDVLVYTTPPLENYMEVTGPVTVTLYASTSAEDTDFTAKLVDVRPDGYARNLTDGIVRARYRIPKNQADPIQSGQVYEYTIDLWATSNLFWKGHRIRLEISSSNFPRFDRNTNTAGPIGGDRTVISALQTIHHDSTYPSHVTLPIVPRD